MLKTVLVFNAIITFVYGLGFVFVPGPLVSLYGATPEPAFLYTGQLFGAALLGYTVILWLARNAPDSVGRRAIVLGLLVANAVGAIVVLLGQFRDVLNALGWVNVAIYVLLTAGFVYVQVAGPAEE